MGSAACVGGWRGGYGGRQGDTPPRLALGALSRRRVGPGRGGGGFLGRRRRRARAERRRGGKEREVGPGAARGRDRRCQQRRLRGPRPEYGRERKHRLDLRTGRDGDRVRALSPMAPFWMMSRPIRVALASRARRNGYPETQPASSSCSVAVAGCADGLVAVGARHSGPRPRRGGNTCRRRRAPPSRSGMARRHAAEGCGGLAQVAWLGSGAAGADEHQLAGWRGGSELFWRGLFAGEGFVFVLLSGLPIGRPRGAIATHKTGREQKQRQQGVRRLRSGLGCGFFFPGDRLHGFWLGAS